MAPSPPAEGSVPIRTGLWCPAHISPSPFLVAQPGQFSPGFLPESFFAELEEGGLVSSSQLFSPQTLLCHGQAETAESAGTSIVPADFAPLGREQSIVVYRRNAVRVASLTWRLKAKKYPQNPNIPPPLVQVLVLPGCRSWPVHCSLQSRPLHRPPHGTDSPEVTTDSTFHGRAAAPRGLLAGNLRRRFKVIVSKIFLCNRRKKTSKTVPIIRELASVPEFKASLQRLGS